MPVRVYRKRTHRHSTTESKHMKLFNWILAPFRLIYESHQARLRQIDVDILWAACIDNTPDEERARAVFGAHAFNDHAWTILGEEDIIDIVSKLPYVKE